MSYWDKALKALETNKAQKITEFLAVMAVVYGIAVLISATLLAEKPTTSVGWLQWSIRIFFNGIVLPYLGICNRIEQNKTVKLTKQIYTCVTKEMNLVKELSLNTHKLVNRVIERPNCKNYQPEDDPKV